MQFGEVWMCVSRDILADRRTDRQTDMLITTFREAGWVITELMLHISK